MGLLKSNCQTYEAQFVPKWIKSYTDIVSLVIVLHLLKYSIAVIRYDYGKKYGIDIPSFGGLPEFLRNNFIKILPENYLADLELIAKEDYATQEQIREISSLPDMTENQIEEQFINLEKMDIEAHGFNQWLINQKKWLSFAQRNEFDDKVKIRIEKLRKWAIENKFLEAKMKRLGWGKNHQH